MTYDWYEIFDTTEFEDSELTSKELSLLFPSIGHKTLLVTHGNYISILYEGIMLSAGMNLNNPFEFEDHALYYDEDKILWLGIPHDS